MMRRASSAGIRLTAADAPTARGMVARGDGISDIWAYFGVNPARLRRRWRGLHAFETAVYRS